MRLSKRSTQPTPLEFTKRLSTNIARISEYRSLFVYSCSNSWMEGARWQNTTSPGLTLEMLRVEKFRLNINKLNDLGIYFLPTDYCHGFHGLCGMEIREIRGSNPMSGYPIDRARLLIHFRDRNRYSPPIALVTSSATTMANTQYPGRWKTNAPTSAMGIPTSHTVPTSSASE